jgi:hypothetical protein
MLQIGILILSSHLIVLYQLCLWRNSDHDRPKGVSDFSLSTAATLLFFKAWLIRTLYYNFVTCAIMN